jgi:acyl-coenzyme A thioesterase PaaI-like protein
MVLNTHLKLDESLNGDLDELRADYAKIILQTTEQMVADEEGLVHGGFVFSAADYAAMACVNHPNVVLAKSEVKFLAPVKLGETVVLEATKNSEDGNRISINVIGKVEEKDVFKGTFYTAVLDKHVLAI